MSAIQASRFSRRSEASDPSTIITDEGHPVSEDDYLDRPPHEERGYDSRFIGSLTADSPPPLNSPLHSDEEYIFGAEIESSGSEMDYASVLGDDAHEPEYVPVRRAPRGIEIDPMRHGLQTDDADAELDMIGPPPVAVGLPDATGVMYATAFHPVAPSVATLGLVFPPVPDYQDPEEAEPLQPQFTGTARSDISSFTRDADADADNERSTVTTSIASVTPSMFSEASQLDDLRSLPVPRPDALHVLLVGHKASDSLKEEILDALFSLYPGTVIPRPLSDDEDSLSNILQRFDYRTPDAGNSTSVNELLVYDLSLRHAVQSYYTIAGTMVTPPVPVLTIFFIDPALCKGRVPGFFPSPMIGKSLAIVLPRTDPSSPETPLAPMGSEHSDLPREVDYIKISRGVDPADLMSAQHIWSNLKASYLFEGIDIRHSVDFDRQVISIDELWAASARYEARAAAMRLIKHDMLASAVGSSVQQAPLIDLEDESPAGELSASTATASSVHTAHAVAMTSSRESDSRAPADQDLLGSLGDEGAAQNHTLLSLVQDATALVGNMHLSKYTSVLPDSKKLRMISAGIRQFVSQNLRSFGALAVLSLAICAVLLRNGSDSVPVIGQPSLAPLTAPPVISRPPETLTEPAAYTQKVHGMDIPCATALLTLDPKKKPLALSAPLQPLSISGAADLKTIESSLHPLPLNTGLITFDRKDCNTCFQLVGSSESRSEVIHLGGSTGAPAQTRKASETGNAEREITRSNTNHASAVETDKPSTLTSMNLVVRDLQDSIGTFVHTHHQRAAHNVHAINALGGELTKKAVDKIVSTLHGDLPSESTDEKEEISWYDEFMEPVRRVLAERRERKELMLAEEDARPRKRRPAREKIQELLFHGAHGLVF